MPGSRSRPHHHLNYMATGKPIINIVPIKDDNSLSFIADYPGTATFVDRPGASVGDDAEKLSNFIANPGAIPQETVTLLLRQFQLPAVEKQYRNLFMSVDNPINGKNKR